MKKETKECIQIYIPLILAVSLNGLTGLVSMSRLCGRLFTGNGIASVVRGSLRNSVCL